MRWIKCKCNFVEQNMHARGAPWDSITTTQTTTKIFAQPRHICCICYEMRPAERCINSTHRKYVIHVEYETFICVYLERFCSMVLGVFFTHSSFAIHLPISIDANHPVCSWAFVLLSSSALAISFARNFWIIFLHKTDKRRKTQKLFAHMNISVSIDQHHHHHHQFFSCVPADAKQLFWACKQRTISDRNDFLFLLHRTIRSSVVPAAKRSSYCAYMCALPTTSPSSIKCGFSFSLGIFFLLFSLGCCCSMCRRWKIQ